MKNKKYTIGMILIAAEEEMLQNQTVEVKTKSGSIFAPVLIFETSPGAIIAACNNFVIEVNKILKNIQMDDSGVVEIIPGGRPGGKNDNS